MSSAVVLCAWLAAAACDLARNTPLDAAAEEYVRLARSGDRSDPAFRQAIATARRKAAAAAEHQGRRAFLIAQLSALERHARFLGGERRTVRQEAAALGLEIPVFDAGRVAQLRARLDAALPGPGGLADRLAAQRRLGAIPRSELDRVAARLVDECRARTPLPTGLIDGRLELRYVLDRPWPAFTEYRGSGRSLVEIRRDAAWAEDELRTVLCHETYPGHHLQNLIWDDLRAKHGWVEFRVTPMFTPHAVMAERAAVAATELAWPIALRPPVARVLHEFGPFAAATAVDIVDGTIARATGLARLRDDLLMPDPDAFAAFVERYRAMAVAYVAPASDVHDWESYLALLRSPERLVAGTTR